VSAPDRQPHGPKEKMTSLPGDGISVKEKSPALQLGTLIDFGASGRICTFKPFQAGVLRTLGVTNHHSLAFSCGGLFKPPRRARPSYESVSILDNVEVGF